MRDRHRIKPMYILSLSEAKCRGRSATNAGKILARKGGGDVRDLMCDHGQQVRPRRSTNKGKRQSGVGGVGIYSTQIINAMLHSENGER